MSAPQAPVALITGGSRGIGLAIARRFLSDGYRVLITGRDRESLAAAASQLGAGAAIEAGDVAIRADVERIAAAAAAHYAHVDVLVNNAGILETVCLGAPLAEAEAIFDRVVDVSLKGAFLMAHALAPILAGPGGRIINIGSNFGEIAFKGRSVYAAAKAGVHHLSRALSLEWAKDGVLVNVVAPCITETESRKNILERPGYKEWATKEMIPRGRWNQPEDLVGAVLFLSSPLADMVVGHVLMVDGGWTIH